MRRKLKSIWISACNYHDVRSEIHTWCALISNNATLKVLGFVFNNHPTVSAHIENVSIKFSRSMWAIIHLQRAMVENGLLVKIYKSSLRPILEFWSLVYHSMVLKEQSEALERLQRRVLRVIYRFKVSREECFKKSGLETLECRRLKRIRKFGVKAAADENFSKKWFPTWENEHEINLRHNKKYIKLGAKTNRLYNSPLHCMRWLLNEEAALWFLWFIICNMTIDTWQKIGENCCK